ncbi:MAG: type VI secretion system lipoprotein TssJ [Myxococcales bacterium]|nr:type VI secretion system lipoprotein TssJ [Myxococcales bacterium]MCB9717378.1 type VI secretion system lipoprotein TssJ [Myxococcales bacterium]
MSQPLAMHLHSQLVLGALLATSVVACKPKDEPTCDPGSVDWKLQLAIQSTKNINPTDDGESLPTVVRVFQLRGELAIDSLDFDKVWAAEEVDELGESFIRMEELTMFPDKNEVRAIPVEAEATHVVAAALVRKPAATSWFTSYEIPVQHPQVVCAKAPVNKVYPNPCFYMLLDRNVLDGGATPPAGYQVDGKLQCAPLGVAPVPDEDDKTKRKRERREKRKARQQKWKERFRKTEDAPDDIERQLDKSTPDVPGKDKLPKTDLPDGPKLPDPKVPDPELPDAPSAPELPKP